VAEEDSILADEWRTFKRVLPKDLHELLKSFEADVSSEIRSSGEGIGGSVEVLTIITRYLDEHRAELKQLASEWKAES
jgi:hypothetical protein